MMCCWNTSPVCLAEGDRVPGDVSHRPVCAEVLRDEHEVSAGGELGGVPSDSRHAVSASGVDDGASGKSGDDRARCVRPASAEQERERVVLAMLALGDLSDIFVSLIGLAEPVEGLAGVFGLVPDGGERSFGLEGFEQRERHSDLGRATRAWGLRGRARARSERRLVRARLGAARRARR